MGVLDADAELLGDERPEPGAVEHAGHPEHALAREARRRHRDVAHRVERIGHDDQDRVRGMLRGLLHDRPDDTGVLGQQVVAAHPRLPGQARGHDDDVGAGRVRVVVGADDARIVPDDRGRLGEVEALALGQPLDDVDQDHVGEAGLGDALGGGGADVAGADHGDLVAGHGVEGLLLVSPVAGDGSEQSILCPRAARSSQPAPGSVSRDTTVAGSLTVSPASRMSSATPSA